MKKLLLAIIVALFVSTAYSQTSFPVNSDGSLNFNGTVIQRDGSVNFAGSNGNVIRAAGTDNFNGISIFVGGSMQLPGTLQLVSLTGSADATSGTYFWSGTGGINTSLTGTGALKAVASGNISVLPTVMTGTLISGTATINSSLLTAHNTWVVDRASSITNLGGLSVTISGSTATIRSSNILDTSVFDLFIQTGL